MMISGELELDKLIGCQGGSGDGQGWRGLGECGWRGFCDSLGRGKPTGVFGLKMNFLATCLSLLEIEGERSSWWEKWRAFLKVDESPVS